MSFSDEVGWVWDQLAKDGLHLNRSGARKLGKIFYDQVSKWQGHLN